MSVEILAPVGSEESLIAAVNSGANAVYLGTKAFNARRNAQNFELADLNRIVPFCHVRNCKVYLTLNILLFDGEFFLCKQELESAIKTGIDAIIVQDLGVARFIHESAPDMPLHGSTQMSVHTLNGALMLKEMGFSRVILSRELSREDISEITAKCGMETEVFVHGALCMSVSGQCQLSAIIGSRSGNRGLCAQPCRLPFSATQENRFDLSLKDLSIIEKSRELQSMGVASLKIEGRMKRPEYVSAAVTACKKALEGTLDAKLLQDLGKVFSRSGFTSGYYYNQIGSTMFGVRGKEDVTSTAEVLSSLKGLYKEERKRVGLVGSFSVKKDKPAILHIHDDEGNEATVSGEIPQVAVNKTTDAARIEVNLNKTGGTPYFFDKIEVEIEEGLAFSASAINAIRREALEAITVKRAQIKPVIYNDYSFQPVKSTAYKKPKHRARFFKFEQIPINSIEALDKIILPLEQVSILDEYQLLQLKGKLIVELPRGMFGSEKKVIEAVRVLKNRNVTDYMATNIAHIKMAQDEALNIFGGAGLNITNSLSVQVLAEYGVKDSVISYETHIKKAKSIADSIPLGIIAYGYLPVMLTRNCPVKNTISCKDCKKSFTRLTDRLGNQFPVVCINGCSEIYNCNPLYMADKLAELNGLSFLLLYFTFESAEQCEKLIKEYSTGGIMPQNATRGLYFRGVE